MEAVFFISNSRSWRHDGINLLNILSFFSTPYCQNRNADRTRYKSLIISEGSKPVPRIPALLREKNLKLLWLVQYENSHYP